MTDQQTATAKRLAEIWMAASKERAESSNHARDTIDTMYNAGQAVAYRECATALCMCLHYFEPFMVRQADEEQAP